MIHEAFPTLTETAFGSHPCCYRGERVPEEHSFYEEVARDLTPANEIVLIGHATGKSNAADFLREFLQTHHPDISRRVIATESADLSALTEPQIETSGKAPHDRSRLTACMVSWSNYGPIIRTNGYSLRF